MDELFYVHTDHAALHWLLTINEPSVRLMRWRLRLTEYDFEVQYMKLDERTPSHASKQQREPPTVTRTTYRHS